jgi:hypothetical protein
VIERIKKIENIDEKEDLRFIIASSEKKLNTKERNRKFIQ